MIFYIDKATQKIHEGTCRYADSLRNSNIVFLGEFPYSEYALSFAETQDYKKA
ncbi:hypothetical protein FV113G1_11300 [Fusobacterium varium]|nr:hypothetical protein FV113G1_11300 [Fusobacterium varium]